MAGCDDWPGSVNASLPPTTAFTAMDVLASTKGPKACTTCAKAKARCIPREDGGEKCERCHRLNKDCFSRPPAPPRVKKRPKRSRVAELEKRLNELSSQFVEGKLAAAPQASIEHVRSSPSVAESSSSSNTNASPPSTAAASMCPPTTNFAIMSSANDNTTSFNTSATQNTYSTNASTAQTTDTSSTQNMFARTGISPPSSSAKTSSLAEKSGELLNLEHLFPSPSSSSLEWPASPGPSARDPASPWPTASESDMLLQEYHDVFAHLFPFVVVPRGMSAAEMRAARPMLAKAVMLVACIFDGGRQARLGEELLGEIARAAVVQGVKSLDLLQCLQLLVAWFHFALKSSQVTNLLFLARSMCVNLSSMSYGTDGMDNGYGDLDHLRAYAGTYYLNTLVLTTNKRTDVFMNTAQLETCCKILESTTQCPSDQYLVKLVRIQQLAQTISLTMAFDPAMPAMSLPLTMVVESFQDQLDTFRATLPAHLADNPTLQCHIAIAEVLLKDVAISEPHCSSANTALTDRLHLLWSCVRSLGTFFSVRFAASELERPRFLTLIASDLAYAFITGIKLLTLRVPGWNIDHIGKELALDHVLGRQINDLQDIIAKRRSGLFGGGPAALEDPLERLLRLLRTANELVALQLSGVSAQEIAHGIVAEMNSSAWQDLVNDAAWTASSELNVQ